MKGDYTMDVIKESMVCVSKAMRRVRDLALKVAKVDSPVLITGESGVGKGLIAKLIHQESKRCEKPLVTANISNFSENLIESELFGHVRGSFTGAHRDRKGLFSQADNGVLFIDEIGDISADIQLKLLRALEEKIIQPVGSDKVAKVDVKMIFATNADLGKKILEESFRKDFFYRINVFPIHIPPLGERKEDILPLAQYFIAEKCSEFGISNFPKLSSGAQKCLLSQSWPGNVRQLQSVIESSLIEAGEGMDELETQNVLFFKNNSHYSEGELNKVSIEPSVGGSLLSAERLIREEFSNLRSGGISVNRVLEKLKILMMIEALETTFPSLEKAPEKVGMSVENFAEILRQAILANGQVSAKKERKPVLEKAASVLSDFEKGEKEQIIQKLTEFKGNQRAAARSLDMTEIQIRTRIKRYGLQEYASSKPKKPKTE